MSTTRLQSLQAMLEASPNDSFLLFAIAKEYESMGNVEAALDCFGSLRDIHPDYVGLYYHLGKIQERKGDLGQAVHTYETGMRVARAAGDQHALNELAGARLEISDD